jgi:hypothetical protein
MNKNTSEIWHVTNYSSGKSFFIYTPSIGIYANKNLDFASVNVGFNLGFTETSIERWECNLETFWNGDKILSRNYIEFGNPNFINPHLTMLFGKPSKNVRWSINIDYKTMWFSPYSYGSLWFNNSFQDVPTTYFETKRSNIFNFGIGISGF